jgi:hypothetical protein
LSPGVTPTVHSHWLSRLLRRCQLIASIRVSPNPAIPTPKRRELIDDIELESADPGRYDRFCHDAEENANAPT